MRTNRKAVNHRQKGYIIGFVHRDALKFTEEPRIYETKKEALDSIKWLSNQYPDVTFTILELQHYLKGVK